MGFWGHFLWFWGFEGEFIVMFPPPEGQHLPIAPKLTHGVWHATRTHSQAKPPPAQAKPPPAQAKPQAAQAQALPALVRRVRTHCASVTQHVRQHTSQIVLTTVASGRPS